MKPARIVAGLLTALPLTAAAEMSGEAVFARHCVHCHADSREAPGTLQLAIRRGTDKAVLAERTDLEPVYIETVVRHGLNAMPPFVPTDLTDDRLAALIAWLTRDNPGR